MNVDVTVRGAVPPVLAATARDNVAALQRLVKGQLMGAHVVLIQEQNPRIERPARAEGEVVLAGRPIRARVAAEAMSAAVDALTARLGEQLRRHVDRMVTRQREPASVEPGQWRHANWAPPRPSPSWRPAGERQLIRRKTFALEPIDALEAAVDMAELDHDFYLYRDADTGADALMYRRDDGRLAVIDPRGTAAPADDAGPAREQSRYSEPLELSAAIAQMAESGTRFLFFIESTTRRGCVLYLREDGHYGLIEPAI